MLDALLHLLGIPTRAELHAWRIDTTIAYDRARDAEMACFAMVARFEAVEADILTLKRQLVATRTEAEEYRRIVGAQRARIEALEEQQPQRRPHSPHAPPNPAPMPTPAPVAKSGKDGLYGQEERK
jgi:predicted  nucleic acid-binding Zn-ribbon protein